MASFFRPRDGTTENIFFFRFGHMHVRPCALSCVHNFRSIPEQYVGFVTEGETKAAWVEVGHTVTVFVGGTVDTTGLVMHFESIENVRNIIKRYRDSVTINLTTSCEKQKDESLSSTSRVRETRWWLRLTSFLLVPGKLWCVWRHHARHITLVGSKSPPLIGIARIGPGTSLKGEDKEADPGFERVMRKRLHHIKIGFTICISANVDYKPHVVRRTSSTWCLTQRKFSPRRSGWNMKKHVSWLWVNTERKL